MQMFVAEVMANVRANVASLGGNGLVSYRMNQCVLMCNPHKNQVSNHIIPATCSSPKYAKPTFMNLMVKNKSHHEQVLRSLSTIKCVSLFNFVMWVLPVHIYKLWSTK